MITVLLFCRYGRLQCTSINNCRWSLHVWQFIANYVPTMKICDGKDFKMWNENVAECLRSKTRARITCKWLDPHITWSHLWQEHSTWKCAKKEIKFSSAINPFSVHKLAAFWKTQKFHGNKMVMFQHLAFPQGSGEFPLRVSRVKTHQPYLILFGIRKQSHSIHT